MPHFLPDVSSDRAIAAWTVEERRKKIPLPRHILIKTILAGNPRCIYNCICQWYETENQVPATEKSGRRSAHGSRTRAVDTDYAKTAKRATISRRLDATTHSESRDADSESFRTGIIRQNAGKWTILHYQSSCFGRKQLYSFMHRTHRPDEFSIQKYRQFPTIMSRLDQ